MPRAELGRVHNKKTNFTGLVPLFDPVHASHDRAGKHVYDRASGFGRACSLGRHITTGAAHVVVNAEAMGLPLFPARSQTERYSPRER